MCLGVPGQIVSIQPDPVGMTMGRVRFGGITKEVCLAYTPEAEVGDYVVVHVGFAITRIDEDEAQQVFRYLEEMGELLELEVPQPGEPPAGSGDDSRSPGSAGSGPEE
jgi:hydrogenase expression/formation protein HypC